MNAERESYLCGVIEALGYAMRLLLAHESHLARTSRFSRSSRTMPRPEFSLKDAWRILHETAGGDPDRRNRLALARGRDV